MTKADLLAGLAAKPRPFTVFADTPAAFEVNLRPLKYGDRSAVLEFHRANKDRPGAAYELQVKLVAQALCDPGGNLLLSEAEVNSLDPTAVDAVAKEVAVRSGINERDRPPAGPDPDPGKADPAATPTPPS